jgi:rhodanese-related sulfurtransferase
MQQISYTDLSAFAEQNPHYMLIDVREEFEHQHFNIGGQNIPLQEVVGVAHTLPTSVPIVLYCKKGIRSVIAIQRLLQKNEALQLINLEGGIEHLLHTTHA